MPIGTALCGYAVAAHTLRFINLGSGRDNYSLLHNKNT